MEFFRRTYLTEGLRDLLTWTARRIGGDRNAPPVVNLQTNFGGGKTHSMLALWHLLSGTPLTSYPDELQKLLAGYTRCLAGARGSRWSGTTSRPGRARPRPDGTKVQTLWGELAWQLGAAAGGEAEARRAYEIVRGRRRDPVQPGAALGELIRAVRAVPDPDRRVGRVRAAAVRAGRPGRRARSTPSSRSRRR